MSAKKPKEDKKRIKKDKDKTKSFGEKLFSRFVKKKDKENIGNEKKDSKQSKKSAKSKTDKKNDKSKSDNKKTSASKPKPTKFIDVTPAEPEELKEVYSIEDVINYRSQVIRSVNDDKRKHLVIQKLRLCSVRFDFSEIVDDFKSNLLPTATATEQQQAQNGKTPKKNVDGVVLGELTRTHTFSKAQMERKEQLSIGVDKKRQMLVEIVEFISTQKWWDEDILKELVHCVTANLFRTLPLMSKKKFVKGDEEEEPFFDPAWLHLQLVYELCLRFLISNDIDKKVMQKYLMGSFVLNLIQLFQSEDLRERDYLKTILHRIYGRFMPLRQQIRTEIANECYRYVYGGSRGVHGIAEFLDIFSSIINGFSIPVKDEHKAFLRNVLLPLHKCDKYEVYFQQLADCCVLFVNKEQSIATTVLGGLLKFWPRLSPTKQAFYLREMLNVIGALVEHENGFSYPKYKDIILLCVDKIFECMESPHFQVADQALSLWKDTVMLYLSKCQKDMIWRRLFIIFKNIQLNHWNAGIKQLTNEVVLYYERIDFQYWKKLKEEYESNNDQSTPNGHTDTAKKPDGETEPEQDHENNGNNHANHKIPVIVPTTLVPSQYQTEKSTKIKRKRQQRESKWKSINEAAMQNKKQFVQENEMNGHTDDVKQNDEAIANVDNNDNSNTDNNHTNDDDNKASSDDAQQTS
eukprot:CAMPEP_0197022400 /NCGR_PEP_ID=MMETSP1384-20130603/3299_1 /TAXON_ID=29189 /ORGANISM="Ammonia sp." /LENGTH=688 /DNA_ID=CAMNT_0042450443 /DNA_START=67 /DNA_END=2130 /DNA_ORIENTATION=+